MNFTEYQNEAKATALYPDPGNIHGLSYCALGLTGEAGEFANKVKKIIRGDSTISGSSNDLINELGDVLWYVSECARNLNMSLELIATQNIAKLQSRQQRAVVKGSGDSR